MSRQYKLGRVAFLLNANAKSVSDSQKWRLAQLIPQEDLYFSKNLEEAEKNIKQIISKGYYYIFSGGGDGTAVSTINLLAKNINNLRANQVPSIGVLRLGTGNALAHLLGAKKPEQDIKAILSGKPLRTMPVSMVESSEGLLTPFAGIGYDGELLNDFKSIKDIFFDSPFRQVFSSFLGFSIAGLFKTLPRQLGKNLPRVLIKSSYAAYRIINHKGKDEEIFLDPSSSLFEGAAPLICVGTVPFVGYGLKLFPFAQKRPGFMHVRVSAVPISAIMANLYPAIWQGSFRHPKLYDFLVKDLSIESDVGLPYQLAGDAMGYKNQLYFKISPKPVFMASLAKNSSSRIGSEPLMTPMA